MQALLAILYEEDIPGSLLAYVCTSTPNGPKNEAILSPTAWRNGGPTGTSPGLASAAWRSHFFPPLLQRLAFGQRAPRPPPLRPRPPRPHGPNPCPKSNWKGGTPWGGRPCAGWCGGGPCGGWCGWCPKENGLKPWNQLLSAVLGVAMRSISCSLCIPLVSQVMQRSKFGHTTHLKRIPWMCLSQLSQTTPGWAGPAWSGSSVSPAVWQTKQKTRNMDLKNNKP